MKETKQNKTNKKQNYDDRKNCICTDGKDLWSGSQQLSATTPANWYWQVRAVYNDKAPPWKEDILQKRIIHLFKYNVMMPRCSVLPNLRKATKDYTMRGDPIFGLVFN